MTKIYKSVINTDSPGPKIDREITFLQILFMCNGGVCKFLILSQLCHYSSMDEIALSQSTLHNAVGVLQQMYVQFKILQWFLHCPRGHTDISYQASCLPRYAHPLSGFYQCSSSCNSRQQLTHSFLPFHTLVSQPTLPHPSKHLKVLPWPCLFKLHSSTSP